MKFKLEHTGFCLSSKHFVLTGTERKDIRFYATYGIIEHPKHGVILFDTGYTSRFYDYTKKFPYALYPLITKVFVEKSEEAIFRLQENGISAEDVKYIIISHFHADHIGGLKDFPNATFICNKVAYDAVKDKKGFNAVRHGFIPMFLPDDFESKIQFINFDTCEKSDTDLGDLVDIFNDNSILLCELGGHAKGQIGAILNTNEGQIFLAADACWVEEAYKENWLPNRIVRFIFDNWNNYISSLKKVQNFHINNPETLIIPCHCEKTMKRVMK